MDTQALVLVDFLSYFVVAVVSEKCGVRCVWLSKQMQQKSIFSEDKCNASPVSKTNETSAQSSRKANAAKVPMLCKTHAMKVPFFPKQV